MTRFVRTVASPVGTLRLVAGDHGLTAIVWRDEAPGRVSTGNLAEADHPVLAQTARELDEYFAGKRRAFTVPLAPAGTAFQLSVWQALLTIPYGETRSYADIARQIGQPNATRAVGAANGRNPISIIAPCHRVIGSNGTLTGFGGGLEAKAYLLGLERGETLLL